jgi:hypothetical protein
LPVWALNVNLRRAATFVLAIIPFEQGAIDFSAGAEASQLAGPGRALQGAGEGLRENHSLQAFSEPSRVAFTGLGQRQFGQASVLPGDAPGGLAVSGKVDDGECFAQGRGRAQGDLPLAMGYGILKALFSSKRKVRLNLRRVKHARSRIGDFSGPSSARGAKFLEVLASRASEGQAGCRLRGWLFAALNTLDGYCPLRQSPPSLRMASYAKDRPSGSARGAESTDNGRLRRGGYLEIAERDHILRVVREANGVIGGPAGAAARLSMKPTTLQSRMKKLRISRHL